MEIRLDGQNLIIPLDEFEARIASRAMPLVSSFIGTLVKLMLRLLFHLLQTDKKTFRQAFERVSAGEDPKDVMAPLLASFQESIQNNPKFFEMFNSITAEEIERLLPEGEEEK